MPAPPSSPGAEPAGEKTTFWRCVLNSIQLHALAHESSCHAMNSGIPIGLAIAIPAVWLNL